MTTYIQFQTASAEHLKLLEKHFEGCVPKTSNHLWSLAITSKTTAELPDQRFIWAHGTVSSSSGNFWTCVFFEVSFSARALLTNGLIAWRNWKGHGVMGEDKANAWKWFFSTYVHNHISKFRALNCLYQNNNVWTYCEDTKPAIYKQSLLIISVLLYEVPHRIYWCHITPSLFVEQNWNCEKHTEVARCWESSAHPERRHILMPHGVNKVLGVVWVWNWCCHRGTWIPKFARKCWNSFSKIDLCFSLSQVKSCFLH